ncbi:hypothetical protein PIIN_11009, partial [Serendipita indica DSM 11827]
PVLRLSYRSYALSEVPTNTGSGWTDTLLVQKCLVPYAM